MKIIRGIYNIQKNNTSSVVTIGNFDGIHLGHQKILSQVHHIGKKHNLITIVVLFEPQPLEFFKKHDAPIRISTLREKIKYIELCKINTVLCIKFNQKFQSLNAEDFITNILIKKLHIKFIVIGNDFKFGFKRTGNIDILKNFSMMHHFNVIRIQSLYKKNVKISSTKIRKALSQNNINLVTSFLGRPYSIIGKVVHGKQLGTKIGCPTANIKLKKKCTLKNGVYAVKIQFFKIKTIHFGIANIGIKPSFIKHEYKKMLEVHIFNQDINLYGKNIEVIVCKKIRNEQFFSSIDMLKTQILKDIKIVKQYFNIKNIISIRDDNE